MSYKIEEIEGIGAEYAAKLRDVDIQTTEDLLRRCGDKKGREGVATETGLSEKRILEWVNRSDLMRVNGVGEEYADLLEEAGVDSVPELAQRNAENLAAAMEEKNAARKLVDRTPSAPVVQKWVDEAKTMDKVVTH